MQITTIGLDIAKNVFQVHGIDAAERVVVRKQLRRGQVLAFFKALPPCLIGMEACATAHYWARELTKLGHTVRLMPAKDVKAYVNLALVGAITMYRGTARRTLCTPPAPRDSFGRSLCSVTCAPACNASGVVFCLRYPVRSPPATSVIAAAAGAAVVLFAWRMVK
jgi:transposase